MEFTFLVSALLYAIAKLIISLVFIFGVYIICRGFLKEPENEIFGDRIEALKKVKIAFKIAVGLAFLVFAISSYNKGFYIVRSVDSKQIHNEVVHKQQYGSDKEIVTPEPRTEKLDGFKPLNEKE